MRFLSLTALTFLATGSTAIFLPPHQSHSFTNVTITQSHASAKHNSTSQPTKTPTSLCVSGVLNRASPWDLPSPTTAPCSRLASLCADDEFICLPPGQKLAIRADPTNYVPPLRPTANADTTITDGVVAPSAPLRPITNTIVTMTTSAPAKRTGESNGWYLECTGPNDVWTYGQVCENQDFTFMINKSECDQWCSCNDKGKMNCPSPVTGCKDEGQVTTMYAKGSDKFSCGCKKLGAQQNDQATVTKRAEAAVDMTTMYGVYYHSSTAVEMEALYLPVSLAKDASAIMTSNSLSIIAPTTVFIGGKYPGTSLTGPTYQDQPFPPEQTTTMYGILYDNVDKIYKAPVYIIPYESKPYVEEVFDTFTITEINPHTIFSYTGSAAAKRAQVTKRAEQAVNAMTTIYGVHSAGAVPDRLQAIVIPQSWASFGTKIYHSNTFEVITPSTVEVGGKKPGTTLKGPESQDQPFPPEQTTTIYGFVWNKIKSAYDLPAWVMAQQDKHFAEDQLEMFGAISMKPTTVFSSTGPAKKLARALPTDESITLPTKVVAEPAPTPNVYDAPTRSPAPERLTTMYGVGAEGTGSRLSVSAIVVAPTDTLRVLSVFAQDGLTQITPSTVLSQNMPTSLNGGNPQDIQATTIYGLGLEDKYSTLVMPAAVVPNSRAPFVQSAYSGLNITQVEPQTGGIDGPTPTGAPAVIMSTVYLYTETVTVHVTAETPHVSKKMVNAALNHSIHSHNFTLPAPGVWPHATHPTTFSTMTVSTVLHPLEARDEHYVCEGNLNDQHLATVCDSTEIFMNGEYCLSHCWCSDAGVVQCDPKSQPPGIDSCGGTNAALTICSNRLSGLFCHCTG